MAGSFDKHIPTLVNAIVDKLEYYGALSGFRGSCGYIKYQQARAFINRTCCVPETFVGSNEWDKIDYSR